jgi:mannitol/fructose-specific phosphotransferase system IIA component (Ntr-type)
VVDYWLDLRMARMSSVELQAMDQEWESAALCLSDALTEENALLPLTGASPREIITQLVSLVAFPESVDSGLIASRLWDREQLASTAMERGVAFLHTARWGGRVLHRHDCLAIGRLPTAVDFGALDGGQTDLIFLLLARDTRRHLVLLAKAARLCRQPGFLEAIRRAATGQEVVRLVRNTERILFTNPGPSLP